MAHGKRLGEATHVEWENLMGMKRPKQIFAEATGLDMEDVLFERAYSDWLSQFVPGKLSTSIARWWASNQGRYV